MSTDSGKIAPYCMEFCILTNSHNTKYQKTVLNQWAEMKLLKNNETKVFNNLVN